MRERLAWLFNPAEPRSTWVGAVLAYAVATAVYFLFARPDTLLEHTRYNHFALLADAWLQGRLDLPDGPPGYAGMNDFAKFEGRWYVAFPPFPALLVLPIVWIAGEPELTRDGQFFLWLAGLGPAVCFVALERLRRTGFSLRTLGQNALLTACFAFGTVYFFTAEQGTVWFAAHVVGVALAGLYLCFSIGAERPLLAGIALGCAAATRAPLLFAVPFFALEALRVSATGATRAGSWLQWLQDSVRWKQLMRLYLWFALPMVVCLGVTFWLNEQRFGDPFENGYKYLTVQWQARMQKWGLFHYHYLSRNLGVVFSMLPWLGDDVPFRINVHGLALWFTTPLYLWLLWPKHRPPQHLGLWLTVACVAIPTVFYQNTGWAQFGYRFSNDYAVFLFALLALGARPLRILFGFAAVWSIAINAFGAWTFDRAAYKKYYYWDGTQTQFYQKD